MQKYLICFCLSAILNSCLITFEDGKTKDRIIKMEKLEKQPLRTEPKKNYRPQAIEIVKDDVFIS